MSHTPSHQFLYLSCFQGPRTGFVLAALQFFWDNMELPLSPPVLGLFALLTILGVYLCNALRFEVDPREPPVIYPKIPLIGHAIGMLVDGLYLKKL
jgi:hypothetical protein